MATNSMKCDDIFQEQNETGSFREQQTKERELKIMLAILESGSQGIAISELERRLKIDRRILRNYLNKLLKKKWIKRGKEFRGTFSVTRRGLEDPSSSAILLGVIFGRGVMQDRNLLVLSDGLRNAGCVDFNTIPQFTSEGENIVKCIFEFSSTIGAFITYVLIQSINANSIKTYSNRIAQYKVSQMWIETAVASVIPYLLPVFKNYVERALSNGFNLRLEEETLDFLVNWYNPLSKYNSKVINRLSHSLGQLYPRIWYALDKINSDTSKELESMARHAEYMRMKNENQHNCKHRFVEVKEPESSWLLKHCECCHYTDFANRFRRRAK